MATEGKGKKDKEQDPDLVIDLDALSPAQHRVPDKSIRFRGQVYKVISFNRLEIGQLLEILDLEQSLDGKEYAEQLKLALRQIEILVPEMPEDVRSQLNAQQIQYLAQEVYGMSGPPAESSGDN